MVGPLIPPPQPHKGAYQSAGVSSGPHRSLMRISAPPAMAAPIVKHPRTDLESGHHWPSSNSGFDVEFLWVDRCCKQEKILELMQTKNARGTQVPLGRLSSPLGLPPSSHLSRLLGTGFEFVSLGGDPSWVCPPPPPDPNLTPNVRGIPQHKPRGLCLGGQGGGKMSAPCPRGT